MGRLFGSKDGDDLRRSYHKTSEHWEQPSLADVLQTLIASGVGEYGELRDHALGLGYQINTFYHAMTDLRQTGRVEQSETTGDYYNGDDGL